MDDRPKRLADYFLVVGLGDTAIPGNESGSTDYIDLPYSTRNPITELAIAHKGDIIPDRFEQITETIGGQSANLNAGNILSVPIFLCFSRQPRMVGKQPAPLQPMCAISVYYPDRNQPITEGHEMLEKTLGGAPADLNLFGRISTYLTFKRGLLYGHTPAITDIVIIGKDQSPPPGFKKLNMNLNKGMGPSLYICYKIAIVKPPSVSYQASILSRYPQVDYEDFPMPESSPLFCLPLGVCVEHWESNAQFPLPTFSTFILTNSLGCKMYGSAVTFYEPIKLTHRSNPRMWEDLGTDDKVQLYMSKCICVLSRWPFFSAFKVFLSSLYRISLSPGTALPIERYVSNLMSDVPFPSVTRPRVMMEIGTEQIVFTLPVQTPLPVSISNHWSLVNSLDPDNCIILFSLLLMEQKVILHSSRPSLLTCVGEALTSVLFPFQWHCPYIPMCPMSLSVYTQAPLPFIIGIDSRYFDHYETPDDVCVVDLDCNTISIPAEIKTFINERPLPSKPVKILRKGLKNIASKLQCMMVDSDLAVELAPLDYAEIESRNSLDQIDINIREVFLRFNGSIFSHYPSCLTPMVADASDEARDAKNLFDQTKFLKLCPPSDYAFYKAVFNTQLFICFVEQRSFSYSMDTTLAFFDECTEKLSRDIQAKLIKPLAESQRQPDVTVVAAPPHGLGLEEDKKYTYDGFPVLDNNLFFTPKDRSASPNSDAPTNTESSSLVMVRSAVEKTKGIKAAEDVHDNPELWARRLLAEIYCLWFVHFPGYLNSEWNKIHHLERAFAVMEEMHKLGAIPSDEVCYRVLMELCVRLWKPFMAVKVFGEMRKAGINPNAVTYGIYNRALIDCNCPPSIKTRWRSAVIVVCTCLYLHKKVSPLDSQDGVQLVRHNSYDEAIGEWCAQGVEPLPKNKGKTFLNNLKARSSTLPKLTRSRFGRASGKKPKAQEQQQQHLSNNEQEQDSETTEDSVGYVVKGGGSSSQQRKMSISHKLKSAEDSPDSLERRHHTSSFSKTASLRRVKKNAPPRMSLYARRFDEIKPSRSSNRMSAYIPSIQIGSNDLNVNISSCTECNKCNRLVYDEDIMSNWSASDADYNTHCPYCGQAFVAQLVVRLQQQVVSTPPQPTRSSTISRIMEEPEQQPTPPARRKRDKPIKLPKPVAKSSLGDGDNASSDIPLSSSDSSPLVYRTAKQGVTLSSDSSPLVIKAVKQEVTSDDSPPVNKITKAPSSDSNLLLNKTTKQEATSSDHGGVVDNTKQEMASPVVNNSKQEVTSNDSSMVNTDQQEISSADNSIVQVTSSNSPKVNTKQEVTSGDSFIVTITKQKVNSFDDSTKKLDITNQTASEKNPEPEKIFIGEASSLMEEVMKHFEKGKVTTSDYYSSTDLQYNEVTETTATSAMSTLTPVTSKDTSSMIAKMKARGHARAQSAPLILEEDGPAVSDNKSKEQATATVDIVNVTPSHSKAASNKEIKPAPPIMVHYLGPLVLRKEVESLLIREGVSYLERQDFPTLSPTVYWNLVWYFTRLGLSSCLPRQALVPFTDFINTNNKMSLTINLLWDCVTSSRDAPLYRLWKDKAAQALYPTDVAGPKRKKSTAQLQSFAARLQCWDLLPVALAILRDRKLDDNSNSDSPRRGLYHDLALFCSCLRQDPIDMERFDQVYQEMLPQLPKDLQALRRKEDELPSRNSKMCRTFFNTLYVL